jgi:hypothetical protein
MKHILNFNSFSLNTINENIFDEYKNNAENLKKLYEIKDKVMEFQNIIKTHFVVDFKPKEINNDNRYISSLYFPSSDPDLVDRIVEYSKKIFNEGDYDNYFRLKIRKSVDNKNYAICSDFSIE